MKLNTFFLISFSTVFSIISLYNKINEDTFDAFGLANCGSGKPGIFYQDLSLLSERQVDSIPEVELTLSENRDFFPWESQIRYSISVSDKKDGESKYGEIKGSEVILKIEFFPETQKIDVSETREILENEPEHKGLTLMKKSTCFGCHADKNSLSGPSFAEMAERYKNTFSNIKTLAGKISDGSSGVWGSSIMPAHPNFSAEETELIAEYILNQGGRKNSLILSGLEGTFHIRKKPKDSQRGRYLLVASYKSRSGVIGSDSVILRVR